MNIDFQAFRRIPLAKRAIARAFNGSILPAAAQLLPLVLLAIAFALTGCDEAHPRSTMVPVADSGSISQWFYNLLFWLDAIILVIVVSVWALALVKFRAKAGDTTEPPQSFGDMRLEVAWTVLPTLIVLGVTVPTLGGVFELARKPDINQNIIEIDVTGKQWWWEFDYIKAGLTGDNGAVINTANEVHVEVGTQVVMHMTSSDVIHSWWIPRVGGKRDATPGRTQPFYFKPNQVGVFEGQCAELCGSSHALMGTRLFVHPKDKAVQINEGGKPITLEPYKDWVSHVRTAAAKPQASVEAGAKVFEKKCTACHVIQFADPELKGFAMAQRSPSSGPNLTHVGSRTHIAARTLENTPENIVKWVKDPQSVKPGAKMIVPGGITDEEAKAVAAFLTSLK